MIAHKFLLSGERASERKSLVKGVIRDLIHKVRESNSCRRSLILASLSDES